MVELTAYGCFDFFVYLATVIRYSLHCLNVNVLGETVLTAVPASCWMFVRSAVIAVIAVFGIRLQ